MGHKSDQIDSSIMGAAQLVRNITQCIIVEISWNELEWFHFSFQFLLWSFCHNVLCIYSKETWKLGTTTKLLLRIRNTELRTYGTYPSQLQLFYLYMFLSRFSWCNIISQKVSKPFSPTLPTRRRLIFDGVTWPHKEGWTYIVNLSQKR